MPENMLRLRPRNTEATHRHRDFRDVEPLRTRCRHGLTAKGKEPGHAVDSLPQLRRELHGPADALAPTLPELQPRNIERG